jgi:hypothetical protein
MFVTDLDTFADLESLYNKVKPLGGSQNKSKNIRPIGERRRKWEHIHKFSDNCYGLFDGGMGDPLSWHNSVVTDTEARRLAAVLWTRSKDGTERVRFRNETGSAGHNSRYSFLERTVPSSMSFKISNGKQFIVARGIEYYLAKGKTIPTSFNKDHSYWARRFGGTNKPDGVAITFVRTDEGFVFDGGGKRPPKVPRVLVDKKKKAALKDDIAAFYAWMCVIAPLLPTTTWEYIRRINEEVNQYNADDSNYNGVSVASNIENGVSVASNIEPQLAVQIIKDYEHTLRTHLATQFLRSNDIRQIKTVADHIRFRNGFNRWINKTLGLTKTTR